VHEAHPQAIRVTLRKGHKRRHEKVQVTLGVSITDLNDGIEQVDRFIPNQLVGAPFGYFTGLE
jgi:hypothetical protein